MFHKPLPIPEAALENPELDHSQINIILNLNHYFSAKASKYSKSQNKDTNVSMDTKLPFDSDNGLCSGLVANWLYFKRMLKEQDFLNDLHYVTQWELVPFLESSVINDPKLDDFINNVGMLQHDVSLRSGIKQNSLAESFELLKSDCHPGVAPAEFTINFVFTPETLKNFIRELVQENKMVRLDNAIHTVGLMYSGKNYYYYNPDSKTGPIKIPEKDIDDLVAHVFSGIGKYSLADRGLALNISIHDLVDQPVPAYPKAKQYMDKLFQDQEYKKLVLSHPEIFRLGFRYFDPEMLDYLFAAGYEYIPCPGNSSSEFEEVVIYRDLDRLNYLLRYNVPIDYRSASGVTPLGRAIIKKFPDMMYRLLLAGADPNLPASSIFSLLDLALRYKNTEAIILLMAAGMILTEKDKVVLYKQYSGRELQILFDHAAQLNLKFLNLNLPLDLAKASAPDLIKFLQHAKFLAGLNLPVEGLELVWNNEKFCGDAALGLISNFYKHKENDGFFTDQERLEIHTLLKLFDMDTYDCASEQELISLIKQIVAKIVAKPIKEHKLDDLLEIEIINDTLQAIASIEGLAIQVSPYNSQFQDYLKKNKVISIGDYITKLDPTRDSKRKNMIFNNNFDIKTKQLDFERDVLPMLRLT